MAKKKAAEAASAPATTGVPNMLDVVEQTKEDFPDAWKRAHTGGVGTEDFIRICAARCHERDPRFGMNGKRGDPQDISDDALNFAGEGADIDPTHGNAPVTVIDVIGGAGGPNPQPQWSIVTNPSAPVLAAWVRPGTVPDVKPKPPEPPPAVKRAYPDENDYWKKFQDRVKKAYNEAHRQFPDPNDLDSFRRFSRCGFDVDWTINPATGKPLTADEAADKHITELRRELGLQ